MTNERKWFVGWFWANIIRFDDRDEEPAWMAWQARAALPVAAEGLPEAAAPQPPVGDVKRYSENWGEGGGVLPDDNGDWCEYEHVTARDQQIATLRAALKEAKGHIANAAFALDKAVPGHNWLPQIRKGLADAKAALGEDDDGASHG